jgi:hypothetical protein
MTLADNPRKPKYVECFCTECDRSSLMWLGGQHDGRCTACGSGRTIAGRPTPTPKPENRGEE